MDNEQIAALCDFIEECQNMQRIWPGYNNSPVDVDMEGCFV